MAIVRFSRVLDPFLLFLVLYILFRYTCRYFFFSFFLFFSLCLIGSLRICTHVKGFLKATIEVREVVLQVACVQAHMFIRSSAQFQNFLFIIFLIIYSIMITVLAQTSRPFFHVQYCPSSTFFVMSHLFFFLGLVGEKNGRRGVGMRELSR